MTFKEQRRACKNQVFAGLHVASLKAPDQDLEHHMALEDMHRANLKLTFFEARLRALAFSSLCCA